MNDQEPKDPWLGLKCLWQEQKPSGGPALSPDQQIAAMRKKMALMHRGLDKCDGVFLALEAVIVVVFAIYIFTTPYFMAQIGYLILIGGGLLATWKTFRRRGSTPQPIADASITEWLKYDLAKVRQHSEDSRTLVWWYLLPFLIGMNVCTWGIPVELMARILLSVIVVSIAGFTYWSNQRVWRNQWLPMENELKSLLQENPQGDNAGEHPPSARTKMRNHLFMAGILLLVLVGVPIVAWYLQRVEPPRRPVFDDISAFGESDIAKLDGWLREQVARSKYPSLSVAIVRDGRIIYQRAFGFEDIKARKKATPETSYHVASVTKVFTASIAVMLHERGVIDLDQPAVKYLPAGVSISTRPELGATITLRQLASHTSGLPRGVPGAVQSAEGRYQLEPKRLYDLLPDVKLESDPGTTELYSNLGFGLLGHVLERAAGKPFDQLLQEMLCAPLHLDRTAINENDRLSMATGYTSTNPRRKVPHSYRERLASSGGLIASAPDLAQFLSAQMKPGFFSSEMLAQLHTPSKLVNGSMAETALGWSIESNRKVGRTLEKNGGRNNCTAWMGFAPEHGVGVVVISNCGEPNVDPIGRWLLERCVPGGHAKP